jgi:hypothetical protein
MLPLAVPDAFTGGATAGTARTYMVGSSGINIG